MIEFQITNYFLKTFNCKLQITSNVIQLRNLITCNSITATQHCTLPCTSLSTILFIFMAYTGLKSRPVQFGNIFVSLFVEIS